jgi:hypothetical protein
MAEIDMRKHFPLPPFVRPKLEDILDALTTMDRQLSHSEVTREN